MTSPERSAANGSGTNLPTELIDVVRRGTVLPVVGAGVSYAVAGVKLWGDFIQQCIEMLHERNVHDPRLNDVPGHLEAKEYTLAGQIVQEVLVASGSFPEILRRIFTRTPESVSHHPLLKAIWALNAPLVLTTNYDRILEYAGPNGTQTLIHSEPFRLLTALRGLTNVPAVAHLHGVYDQPDSVIFSQGDYERLNTSDAYRDFTKALWMTHTLLYIGASPAGIDDPDFTELFSWGHHVFPDSPAPHYALMKAGTVTDAERYRLLAHLRVRVVEYGDHSELPDLVNRLAANGPARSEAASPWIRVDAKLRELNSDEIEGLVNRLLALQTFRSPQTRIALAKALPASVAYRVVIGGSALEDALSLTQTCLEQDGALAEMLKRLRFREGAESRAFKDLIAFVRRLFPDLIV